MAGAGGLAAFAVLYGLMVWWCSNTVAHIHLHRPLFRTAASNRAFGSGLTLLLGIPQTLWKSRHLAHHFGPRAPSPSERRALGLEIGIVLASWLAIGLAAPSFLFFAWLPGWAGGLVLCNLQGRGEHSLCGEDVPSGISHYGRWYNLVWFNDGYHAEHHRWPDAHWSTLPLRRGVLGDHATRARAPVVAALSLLESPGARCLVLLERLAMGSPWLRRWLVRQHRRALATLLGGLALPAAPRVAIVGGGLFPRTALAIRPLLPGAELVILDRSARHIASARPVLEDHGMGDVAVEETSFAPGDEVGFDLVILPLAYVGDRNAIYGERLRAPALVHDWLWRGRGTRSTIVSRLLLKRLNRVDVAAGC